MANIKVKISMYLGIILHIIAKCIFIMGSYLIHYFLGKTLTSVEYGMVGTIITIINFGYLFLNNGVRQAISKEISQKKYNTMDIIKKGLVLQGAIVLCVVIFTLGASHPLSYFLKDNALAPYISMTAAIIPFMGIYFAMLGVFNGIKQFKVEAVILMIYPIIKLLIIPFVDWGHSVIFDVECGFLVSGISIMLICIIAFRKVKPTLDTNCSEKIKWVTFVKNSLSYSFMFIATSIIMNVDLLIVKSYVIDGSDAGYYTGAVNFAKIPYYLLTAVFLVLLPVISSYHSEGKIKEARKEIKTILNTISATVFPVVIIICCSAEKLLEVFYKPEYAYAGTSLIYLMLGTFLLGMIVLINMIISAINKKLFTSIVAIFMVISDVTLCLILTPLEGINGAAISNLCTNSVACMLSIIYLIKYFGNVFDINIVKNVLISFLTGGVVNFLIKYFDINNIIVLVLMYVFVYICQLATEIMLRTLDLKSIVRSK